VNGPRPFRRELRPPPRAFIELPLEGRPQLRLVAETHEDELRLLGWLSSTSAREWLLREALAQLHGPEEAA
jgi:hypothetical protein